MLKEPTFDEGVTIEDRAGSLQSVNSAEGMRREIDALLGLDSPSWNESVSTMPGYFSAEELAMLVYALGGPVDAKRGDANE